MFWFFSRLKKKLEILEATNSGEVSLAAIQLLKNWADMSLIFNSNTFGNTGKKHSQATNIVRTPVLCTECKEKYIIKGINSYLFKKLYNQTGKFDNCKQHASLELEPKQIKMDKEYVEKVNKLYNAGFSKEYGKIMEYLDSAVKEIHGDVK